MIKIANSNKKIIATGNMKIKNSMIGGIDETKQLAIDIIDEFENLLDEKNITIPSRDREGGKDEARIYGEEYYNLEDSITNILKKNLKRGAIK